MAFEQWGFFSLPHLLWHGVSVNNDHLRGPLRLTPSAERLAVAVHVATCFYDLGLSRVGLEHKIFLLQIQRSNPLRHRRGV